MDQYVAFLAVSFYEIEGRDEGEGDILVVGVFHVQNPVFEALGVFEVDLGGSADSVDFVLLEFLKILSEVAAADPDLT